MIQQVTRDAGVGIRSTTARCVSILSGAVCATVLCIGSDAAHAQAAEPTLFVGNNGNIEGSISSLRINEDGSLTLLDTIVLGQVSSSTDPCPGCNTYTLSLTPNGKHLVAGHPSSDVHPVHVSITRVHEDSTLELVGLFPVPRSPLSVVWLDNEHFAVTRASFTGVNEVRVYHFDDDAESISFMDGHLTGGFTTALDADLDNRRLFAERGTNGNAVLGYSYDEDGNLAVLQEFSIGSTWALGLGLSPDGSLLYGGGGSSDGGDKIPGIGIDEATGQMSALSGSPFVSPGDSPKQVVVSDDSAHAIVGHGADATVRTFAIDPDSGALSATGHSFDVGFQGTLGDTATANEFVFFTDNSTIFDGVMGVYSFTLGSDGTLSQNGPIVDSGGTAPKALAPWFPEPPPCPGDLNGDGVVDVFDLLELISKWGDCEDADDCPADLNDDGVVDVFDLLILIGNWGECQQ